MTFCSYQKSIIRTTENFYKSDKLRATNALVPYVPCALCTLVPCALLVLVPYVARALRVPCLTCLVRYVLPSLTCLRPYASSCLTCFVLTCYRALRASCPTCSRASRVLHTLVPHVSSALRFSCCSCLVPYVFFYSSSLTFFSCFKPNILICISCLVAFMSCGSCAFGA